MSKTNYLFVFLLFFSCDLIDYHPYDGKLSTSERDINNRNIERIETATKDKGVIRFAMISDTQRKYDETNDFVKHINQRDDIDFIIHGGDIADFGLKKEYEWTIEILSKLKQPYIAIIGNHDALGNGDNIYGKLYGVQNFSFVADDIKFLCLNTNALEYDYTNPIPDFEFLKKELGESSPEQRTIVVMHAPPGNEQFNNNVKDVFQAYIKRFPHLMFCLNGHDHRFYEEDLFNDGIIYYGCGNIRKRGYYLFTITSEGYTHEIVYF
ncbi:MAG: metallophosphoesterase [Bacteroidales bacterium]|nr:metallophosphoesterase [Bacteroidales bacterium]